MAMVGGRCREGRYRNLPKKGDSEGGEILAGENSREVISLDLSQPYFLAGEKTTLEG